MYFETQTVLPINSKVKMNVIIKRQRLFPLIIQEVMCLFFSVSTNFKDLKKVYRKRRHFKYSIEMGYNKFTKHSIEVTKGIENKYNT